MVFSKDDLSLIKILRQEKHYGAQRFLKEFSNRNWSIAAMNRLIAKIDATGSAEKRRNSRFYFTHSLGPDLNPVDYKIWSVLQERVYQTRIRDVDHLKQRLVEEWNRFDQGIVDRAINKWRDCLRACIRANGGHFEHQL